ncbi:MAG: hypothetical protein A4E45_01706 [Methanosaeta sp. PtaB.Bin039]|nr:MAG: hypothetical protein A4E45_01706 [Methanosaeta sp. PtaB.Bin039]OPY44977.1 MAG: hypothetical protein A4E47_01211 [Methanosaeta sp. PtaU1.Bin028]HOT07861.1 hypothetical protein [Methanotrichaceae archaeon]HQF17562.1 hypothetical protein [Methanotrichaceae archaeon]HQI92144.1 hypothetical protein [Methanotrichaceae archaeon]
MARRLKDLDMKDFKALPPLTHDHTYMGWEMILLHLYNGRNMHWYMAEFDPMGQRFFGYFEGGGEGINSGLYSLDFFRSYDKKGGKWEVMVDDDWKQIRAQEIPILKNYIKMMICPQENF